MRCPECGNRNPPEFRFCGYCGQPLGETPFAEKRWATILFFDISGFSSFAYAHDLEETHEELNDYLSRRRECISRYGGQVDKFYGDGLLAIFGARNSRENEPLNALRAAHCMVSEPGGVFRGRAGVTTGMVIQGPLGGRERAHQTVIGDVVNLAQRMVAAAPAGSIWLDGATQRLVPEARVRALGPRLFKGFKDPLPVWEFAGWGGRTRPFFGRRAELETLLRLAEKGATEPGRVITVAGPMGIGKSYLIEEALRLLSSRFQVVRIPELNVTYPIRLRLRETFAENFGGDPRTLINSLGIGELDRRLVFYALGYEQERPAPLEELEGSLANAFRRVIELVARERPTIFVVSVGGRDHPLIGTIMDSLRKKPIHRVTVIAERRQPLADADIVLGPLSETAAEAYINHLNPTLDADGRKNIREEAKGNPLLIRLLATADQPHASPLAAFQSRLDKLPLPYKDALLYAALGKSGSWLGVLKDLLGEVAEEAVAHLIKDGYLEIHGEGLSPESRLEITNPMLAEAARELLGKGRRRRGHEAYWRWLSRQPEKRLAVIAAEHAEAAGMPAEAARSWMTAAEYHRHEGIFTAADEYYRRALAAAPEPEKEQALQELAEMHLAAGSAETALALLERRREDWAKKLRGLAYAALRREKEARELLEPLREQEPRDIRVLLALCRLEEPAVRQTKLRDLKRELEAQPERYSHILPSLSLRLAESLAELRQIEEAGREMRKAFEGFASGGNRSRAAEAALAISGYMWHGERLAAAAAWADRAIEHGRHAHPGLATAAWSVRAGLWLDQGRPEEAGRALKQAEKNLGHARNDDERARIHAIRMRYLAETGRFPAAISLGEELFAELPHPWLAANLALAYAVDGGSASGEKLNGLIGGFYTAAPPPGKSLFLMAKALRRWQKGDTPIPQLKEALRLGYSSGPYLRYLTLILWGVYLLNRNPRRALALTQYLQRRSSSGGFMAVNHSARLLRAELALAADEPVGHLLRFDAKLAPQRAWQKALLVRAGVATQTGGLVNLSGYGILGAWARLSWRDAVRAKRYGSS